MILFLFRTWRDELWWNLERCAPNVWG